MAWLWVLEAPGSHPRRDSCEESNNPGTLHETRRYFGGQVLEGTSLVFLLSPSSTDASRQECILNRLVVPDRRWQIGILPEGITADEVKIIGAIHVSAGSWMPIIQLTRHVF